MWYKFSHFIKDRLILKLALAVTFLMVSVYLLNPFLQTGLYYLLDFYYYDLGHLDKITEDYRTSFQEYITDNNIDSKNLRAVFDWNQDHPDITLVLTDELYILYYSYAFSNPTTLTEYNNSLTIKELISSHAELHNTPFYLTVFSDGVSYFTSLEYYGYSHYYLGAYYLSMALSFLLFLIPLLLMIRRKTKYIQRLAAELRILEGGDLKYPITENGSDELYELAHGINQMRLSILEKQLQEVANQNANHKLVTSLSHDLRTPLTSIIGYLEILSQHKYKDEEQLQTFIQKCQEKAFTMKDMSDKLFEYFLVSQKVSEEYHMEAIPVADLISGLLDNQVFDLKNVGFTVKTDLVPETFVGCCRIDVEFMQRVLDNILSNIRKYAAPNKPVEITALQKDGLFRLEFSNGILENTLCSESTGIGLKTCEKIMAEHCGELIALVEENTFISTIILPCY